MDAVTKGGKVIEIVPVPGKAMLKIQFAGGGRIPKKLSGMFTGRRDAESAIAGYLAKSGK